MAITAADIAFALSRALSINYAGFFLSSAVERLQLHGEMQPAFIAIRTTTDSLCFATVAVVTWVYADRLLTPPNTAPASKAGRSVLMAAVGVYFASRGLVLAGNGIWSFLAGAFGSFVGSLPGVFFAAAGVLLIALNRPVLDPAKGASRL